MSGVELGHRGAECSFDAFVRRFGLDAKDVVGRRAEPLRRRQHLARRHVEELGLLVYEPLDEPRAGDPIDPAECSRVIHFMALSFIVHSVRAAT